MVLGAAVDDDKNHLDTANTVEVGSARLGVPEVKLDGQDWSFRRDLDPNQTILVPKVVLDLYHSNPDDYPDIPHI